jgi:hypothetical protein
LRAAGCALPLVSESTVSEPQSPRDAVDPGALETSWPSARSPSTVEPVALPPAMRALAPAVVVAVSRPATTSPLKSDSTITSADACAAAASPGCAETFARAPDADDRPVVRVRTTGRPS